MQYHGLVCKINQWFRHTESQWPQSSPESTNKDKGFHYDNSKSSDKREKEKEKTRITRPRD